MQTIKNDNERKPRTIGETMESFTNTKKRVTKSILSYTGTFISLLLIFIAIAVLTTEVNLTSAVEVVELGLTLFILIFCAYSMYVNLANSGEKAAKSGKTYIDTETKYDSTKKIIKDEKMQSRGSEFCNYWSREELKNTRCQFLDEVGIDFDVYMKSYVGKTKEELEQIIKDILASDLDLYSLPLPDEVQIDGKYNEFIPKELLRKQFIEDYLDFTGLKEDIRLGE